jgi:endoglucanase
VQPGLERSERPRPAGGRLALAAAMVVLSMVGVFLLAVAWLSMAGVRHAPRAAGQAGHSLGKGAPGEAGGSPATGGVAPAAWTGLPAATRLQGFTQPQIQEAAARLRSAGQQRVAARLAWLAAEPSAFWASGQPGDIARVRALTQAAARAGASAVVVAYNIPARDACGRFSVDPSGPGPRAYRTWIRQLAAAIGDAPDIVIVEPDAVADALTGCLSPQAATVRFGLLRYAMSTLGALPRDYVYLDAGNPGMVSDPAQLAGPLQRAGIGYGRGLAANVSNFYLTSQVVAWCQALERALASSPAASGGRHATPGAVIDTSRNGNGPYAGHDSPQWCNPPGRAPGPSPRVDPGPAGIDAYLWIKPPGASDGPCNGGPAAGQFWPRYAVGLARAWATRE